MTVANGCFCSPLYSTEVMEEAIEPLSQSLSMFLLDALLSTGNESIEQTDPALEDNQSLYIKQLITIICRNGSSQQG